MTFLIALFVFLFGSIIGSFLNVVALRYNTGMTVGGRSTCFSCGKKLSWHELFPIISYIVQSGRCKSCRTRISAQYPIVETLSGFLFVTVFFKFTAMLGGGIHIGYGGLVQMILSLIVFCILLVITVYDFRHTIIPNGLVYTFAAISFLGLFLGFSDSGVQIVVPAWSSLMAGPIYFLAFAALWFFSRGKWIGFGDAKLALGMGWFLGLIGAGAAIMFAFWVGAVIGVILILAAKVGLVISQMSGGKHISFKSEIPFAPFLIAATFFVFYTGITLQDVMTYVGSILS